MELSNPYLEKVIEGLHPLERRVLPAFRDREVLTTEEILNLTLMDKARLEMACGWLLKKGLIELKGEEIASFVTLTEIGRNYSEKNTPEIRIVDALRKGIHLEVRDIIQSWGMDPTEVSSAIGALKEAGIVEVRKGGSIELKPEIDTREFKAIQDLILFIRERGPVNLNTLSEIERTHIDAHHRKRGKAKEIFRISEKRNRVFSLSKAGRSVLPHILEYGERCEGLSTLTPEMLKDGTWRIKRFRKYNISLGPPRVSVGKRHPYREFLDFVKAKFVAMGFEEMRGPLVENEFWNMDALYMPQFHPARDIHDVYFLKEPSLTQEIERPFGRRVKAVHSHGGITGSKGWRYPFDLERAKRLILRSQGTAISARRLASGPKVPGKYFSIARCFRYDTVDATHAPDFYQIEGIVLGERINFKTLLGILKLFGEEIAMVKDFRFLPAYFPFTEPSVELHGKHPRLGWMELGGAGIFRPEVTIPLGVKELVVAWGLGLDRMAMLALDIHDIRDLFSIDIDFIRTKKVKILSPNL